jgi:hypothetical protein
MGPATIQFTAMGYCTAPTTLGTQPCSGTERDYPSNLGHSTDGLFKPQLEPLRVYCGTYLEAGSFRAAEGRQ